MIAENLVRKTHQRDGLPEIAVGLLLLSAAGLLYAQATLPRGSAGYHAAILGFAIGFPALCLGATRMVRWVRLRLLLERVGYVHGKPLSRKQIGLGVGGLVLLALVLLGVALQLPRADRWLLAGTGLMGGGLLAWCGRQPRFLLGGLWMAATGIAAAFSGFPLEIGFTILFGCQGLLTLVTGAVVLWRFLRP